MRLKNGAEQKETKVTKVLGGAKANPPKDGFAVANTQRRTSNTEPLRRIAEQKSAV
jgi:hypothetical protein